MKETIVNKFSDLHDLFEESHKRTIYRGQSDADWDLIPKAGRIPYKAINDVFCFGLF